jgi:hypothetical protein
VCASAYGLPDIGLLTLSEMAERARVLVGLLDVPLIADADTGYGSPINVVRTVREYERQTPSMVGRVSPEGLFDLFGLSAWNALGERYRGADDASQAG